ncbi:MAG: glycosyltransferase family 4 protein [Planctomycetota bacterium]
MKICLTSNTAWNLAHFRMNHMTALQDMGIEVHAVAPADGYEDRLTDVGIHFHPWKIERRSLNPLKELVSVRRIQKIYSQIKPDLVHHYTVKAVLYGTTAARFAGVPAVVNSVTGLPYIIVSPKTGWTKRLARWVAMRWYGWTVMGKNTHVVLQNHDDLDLLESFAIGVRENATVTNGSGVDLDRFRFARPSGDDKSPVNVLFVGRFLREKGVFELMEAVREMRARKIPFELRMCGGLDPGNRSSVSEEEFEQWKQDGLIDWSGHVDDVRDELVKSDIVVLPSYREGTPRSLLEAMAVGRPLVTTDVPGCRNVVQDRINGLMVPSRTSKELAEALTALVRNEDLRLEMGEASRKMAEDKFDEREVIEQTLQVYRKLSGKMPPIDEWEQEKSPATDPPTPVPA